LALQFKELHVGFYGAVMGLAGLGLAARSAAPLFPGVFRAPSYFTEPWVAAGAIALVILVAAHAVKLFKHPEAVRADFTDPSLVGFCGALPVGMTLVAGGLGPYAPGPASALWWAGCALLAAFQVWGICRLLTGAIELARLNAGWLILMVGGIVVPGPGVALGHAEASHFFFGFSASVAPVLAGLIVYRAAVAAPLPEALRPTWFILLVPPSLIYANGLALYPDFQPLESLYFLAVILAGALLVYARGFLRWPFAPSWWAFTFPLDALAYAAVRYAQDHPSPLWRAIAAAALALATFFVALVLVRTLRSAASPRA
jgi:tellurite resistance protein